MPVGRTGARIRYGSRFNITIEPLRTVANETHARYGTNSEKERAPRGVERELPRPECERLRPFRTRRCTSDARAGNRDQDVEDGPHRPEDFIRRMVDEWGYILKFH